MNRLPLLAFGALAAATIAAFFITQHLKVTTPLIEGKTYLNTPHIIDPTDRRCPAKATTLFFDVLHHADSVQVTIVDHNDKVVRTLAVAVPAAIKQPLHFTWDGRLANGQLAPAGLYNFRVRLLQQNRTIDPVIPGFPLMIEQPCPGP